MTKPCNLCTNENTKIFYKLKTDYHIQKCSQCGLVARDHVLTQEKIHELYGEHYYKEEQYDYFFNNPQLKEDIFTKRLLNVEDRCKNQSSRKIYDVGCAIGTFLKVAKARNWDTVGVEISEYASQYARDKFGLNVITGSMEQGPQEEQSIDAITMWDVIDHFEHPQKALEFSHKLLKKDGILVVQTNMEDSLLYRMAHYFYKLSGGLISFPVQRTHPIHHSTFYSTKTLKKALEKAGFSRIETDKGDLNSELINVKWYVKIILKFISILAGIVNKPLETVFYAYK